MTSTHPRPDAADWEPHVDTLTDALPEAVIATDAHGRVLAWNRAAVELYGYDVHEALGRSLAELLPAASLRRSAEGLAWRVRDDVRSGIELLRAKAGHEIAVQFRTAPLCDALGQAVGRVCVSRRVGDDPGAEWLLRQNAEMYALLFKASPIPRWIIDRDTLRFLDVNDAAMALYGYSREEFRSLTLDRLHPDTSLEALHAYLGNPVGDRTRHHAMKHRARDGRELDVAITRSDIEYMGCRARLASIIDQTEQRAAERELRRREELFRTLTENGFDVMAIFSPDGTISMTSTRAMGYAATDVVGRNLADFVHADDIGRLLAAVAEVASGAGARQRVEFRLRDAGGAWRVLEGDLVNLLDSAVIAGIAAHCRDVTEQRTAERALRESELQLQHAQKMEAVGRLAGGVAHDFNNLLTAIRGYSELVRMTLPAEHEAQPEITEVLSAVDRAASLTRQLLAYSRRQLLQPTLLSAGQVVRNVEKMLRRLVYENIDLELSIEEDTPPIVGDESQLQQVVMNLVVNARDAMHEGGLLSIHVYTAEIDAERAARLGGATTGRFAAIAVADNGIGMPPAVREHIFEPFFTTKPMGEGTGLGLSTVYGIVRQSGGYIDVHSVPGEGTRFDVFFPAAAADALLGSAPSSAPATRDSAGTESVLLVEDSASVRVVARRALQNAGYRVIDVRDGAEALDVAAGVADRIDIVVTDVVMPRVGGIELIQRLRAAGFTGAILAMTGYSDRLLTGDPGAAERAAHAIEKPFTMAALVARVRATLDQRCAMRAPLHDGRVA